MNLCILPGFPITSSESLAVLADTGHKMMLHRNLPGVYGGSEGHFTVLLYKCHTLDLR